MADFSATSRIETPFNAEQLQIYLVEVFDPGFRNFLNDLPELNGDSYTEGGGMEVTSVTSPIVGMHAFVFVFRLLTRKGILDWI